MAHGRAERDGDGVVAQTSTRAQRGLCYRRAVLPSAECPKCSRAVPVAQLKEESGFAVCPCGGLFQLVGMSIYDGHRREHRPLPTPPSFSVTGAGSGLPAHEAEGKGPAAYREAGPKRELSLSFPIDDGRLHRPMLWIFSVFLWVMIAGAAPLALGGETPASRRVKGNEPLVGKLVVGLLGPPALAVTYFLVVALKNRTTLTLREGQLRVHHGPLPLLADTSLSVGNIDRLYGVRELSGARTQRVFYSLQARLRSGEVRPILHHLARPLTAMYVQQCIEDCLELPARTGTASIAMLTDMERSLQRRG